MGIEIVPLASDRLRNQGLTGALFSAPEAAVRWLGAVQAQDYHGAKWALALRTRGVTSASIDRAFNDGSFIRTHVMRPTWHFVAPEDLRWLLALTGPRVHALNATMYRKVELTEDHFRRTHALLTAALQERALTRSELATVLEAHGIPARGQRLGYIMMQAELSGLICSGPMRGKQHTYALLEERVPAAPLLARDEALATLARCYFRSHGPATVHDFAWWSGLTVTDARSGLASVRSELESSDVDGTTYWMPPGAEPVRIDDPMFHLLPNYDEHVVAYRDHTHSIDPAARDALRIRKDRPVDAHLVCRNGLVVGGWKRKFERAAVVVTMNLLVGLRRRERAALERAVEAYGRFIGLPVVLEMA